MTITEVRVRLLKNDSAKLKAVATITIDSCFFGHAGQRGGDPRHQGHRGRAGTVHSDAEQKNADRRIQRHCSPAQHRNARNDKQSDFGRISSRDRSERRVVSCNIRVRRNRPRIVFPPRSPGNNERRI